MDALAVGKSISFRPPSLYDKALEWGRAQRPVHSVSVVICLALTEFLERRGVSLDAKASAVEDGLQAKVKELCRELGPEVVEAKLAELTAAAAESAAGGRQ